MTWKYRYKKQIIIGSGIFFLLIVLIVVVVTREEKQSDSDINLLLRDEEVSESDDADEVRYEVVFVDIKGQVVNPGLYELTSNHRVSDVIERAGGLTVNADVSVINLSKRLRDEMVIIIHSKEEVRDFRNTQELERRAIEQCRALLADELRNDACIGNDDVGGNHSVDALININTATKEELTTLSGIGESRALAIIAYREENGRFNFIEDIKNVSGIGESIFANIASHITI